MADTREVEGVVYIGNVCEVWWLENQGVSRGENQLFLLAFCTQRAKLVLSV